MIKKRMAAFLLAAALGTTAFTGCGPKNTDGPAQADSPAAATAVEAVYPVGYTAPEGEDFGVSEAYGDWWQNYRPLLQAAKEVQEGMPDYYAAVVSEFMSRAGEDNAVCSPLNIYFALAMLSEVTEGESRTQILEVLQAADIEALRTRAKALWEANYVDTPNLTSLLADSFWLRDSDIYNEETLKTLAEQYYASSFTGEMGSADFNRQLQEWTDKNTGGLLSEYTKDLAMDPETVMALVSTIYYRASWMDNFQESNTSSEIFHGSLGDTEAEMMHKSQETDYFEGSNFTAVQLPLTDSGYMTFFLPDEGVEAAEVMAGEEMLDLALNSQAAESRYARVNLTIPKFRAEQKTDLLEIMAELGMTDILDPARADFSALLKPGTTDPVSVSSAEHAAVLELDEEGVTGAAYTAIMMTETSMIVEEPEEVDFTLDRPFGFTVTGRDGSLLFAGVVNHI